MRTECQHAEVALSYVRRLIQGRLDIVNTFLEYPPVGPRSTSAPSYATCPASSPPDRGGLPGSGTCPCSSGRIPRTELTDELMAELDSVLGAEEIGRLADLLPGAARGPLGPAESTIERRVSGVRRALHERIDALQAEVVERHKTGQASVDGLLG